MSLELLVRHHESDVTQVSGQPQAVQNVWILGPESVLELVSRRAGTLVLLHLLVINTISLPIHCQIDSETKYQRKANEDYYNM